MEVVRPEVWAGSAAAVAVGVEAAEVHGQSVPPTGMLIAVCRKREGEAMKTTYVIEETVTPGRDYLWEYAAILLWEHVLGTMLVSEEPEGFGGLRHYAKLA